MDVQLNKTNRGMEMCYWGKLDPRIEDAIGVVNGIYEMSCSWLRLKLNP